MTQAQKKILAIPKESKQVAIKDLFLETKSYGGNSLAVNIDNAETAIAAIVKARPASTKGNYILSCTLSATMSPGVKIELKDILKAEA